MLSEEDKRIFSYLYFDHLRKGGDPEEIYTASELDWGYLLCLLEFAHDIITERKHGSDSVGCDCEFCIAKREIVKQGMEFVEVCE